MSTRFSKSQITLAVVAAVGAAALGATPSTASAKKDLGTYVSGILARWR